MPDDETAGNCLPQFPRRVAAMVIYLHPFRMIESEALEEWTTSIEQINRRGWDYVKLHEIAGGIDVGLSSPYHMLVGRDGALALPPIPQLRSDQQAVEFFNRCLASFLLGGIYCTAVSLDHLEFGSIIDWKYIRSHSEQSGANHFHRLVRMQMAAPIDAIALKNPSTLHFDALQKANKHGFALLKSVPQLSPEFLLKGVSGIARRDWGVALSNLWITVEQLTEALWQRDVLMPVQSDEDRITGRVDQLKDTRTWTAANRHELLHLKNIVSDTALRHLCFARRARNDLSHRGAHPTETAAHSAYSATLALLQAAVGTVDIPLASLNLSDHSLSDPFKPRESRGLDPQYWMAIPKLPGEAELEREEACARESPTQNS